MEDCGGPFLSTRKVAFVHYNINRDSFAININRCTLNDNIKKIKLSTVISDYEQLIINNIWSLILVK